jgi:hypothetical protein
LFGAVENRDRRIIPTLSTKASFSSTRFSAATRQGFQVLPTFNAFMLPFNPHGDDSEAWCGLLAFLQRLADFIPSNRLYPTSSPQSAGGKNRDMNPSKP